MCLVNVILVQNSQKQFKASHKISYRKKLEFSDWKAPQAISKKNNETKSYKYIYLKMRNITNIKIW